MSDIDLEFKKIWKVLILVFATLVLLSIAVLINSFRICQISKCLDKQEAETEVSINEKRF